MEYDYEKAVYVRLNANDKRQIRSLGWDPDNQDDLHKFSNIKRHKDLEAMKVKAMHNEVFRQQLRAGLDTVFGLNFEDKDARAKEAHDAARAVQYRATERYAHGWTNALDVLGEIERAPEPAHDDHIDALMYVRPPKITWWTRLIWRLWRWAKRRIG